MRRGLLGGTAGAMAACALALFGSVPALAADEITIDHVESSSGTVSALLAVDGLPPGVSPEATSVTVTLDGVPVEAEAETIRAGEIARTTILAIDASNSMRGQRFASAQQAAKAFLSTAPADVRIGLLTFAGSVQDTVAPTTDHDSLITALDGITLSEGTGVYDAMVQSSNLAGDEGARSVLVLSDGADTGSDARLEDVIRAAKEAGVIVDVVSLDQSPKNEERLTSISQATGGKVIPADPEALSDVFTAQAAALASQLLVTFPSPPEASEEASLEVSVTAAGRTYTDSAFVSLEPAADAPDSVDLGSPLVSRGVMLLGAIALGLGLAGLLGVVLLGSRGPSSSQKRLSAYFGDQGMPDGSDSHRGAPSQAGFRDSAMAMTEKMVKGDLETRISQRLAGAGSQLTAAEWLLLHAGIAVGSAFAGYVLAGAGIAALLLVLGGAAPWLYLKFRHRRRLNTFNGQLAETLGLMAGGLQAGLSLPQAVDTVVREGHEPMSGELKRALLEQRLGVAIEDALDGVGQRMDSADFGWIVMAIRIQREVGGNLAEILQTVAETLREREYLRRQVKALSAEGRLSGWILGGLPPAMFFYMVFANGDYVRPLYTTLIGWAMIGAACVLLAIGGFLMAKIAKVEI